MKSPAKELDPTRRVHRALRRTVTRDGEDMPKFLYACFAMFNAAFFDNRLGEPMILISPPTSARAEGDYTKKDLHGLTSRIRLAPNMLRHGVRWIVATLLHEMVHAWAHEVNGDTEESYRGHGPKFAAKCNEIGEQLGFPTVAPKGRKGRHEKTHNAAHWPELPEGDDRFVKPGKEKKPEPVAPVGGAEGGEGEGGDLDGERIDPFEEGRRAERAHIVSLLGDWHATAETTFKTEKNRAKLRAVLREIAEAIAGAEGNEE